MRRPGNNHKWFHNYSFVNIHENQEILTTEHTESSEECLNLLISITYDIIVLGDLCVLRGKSFLFALQSSNYEIASSNFYGKSHPLFSLENRLFKFSLEMRLYIHPHLSGIASYGTDAKICICKYSIPLLLKTEPGKQVVE